MMLCMFIAGSIGLYEECGDFYVIVYVIFEVVCIWGMAAV